LRRLTEAAGSGSPTEVLVVHGPPGETALVVRAGYRLADLFPDGCLFVNLRGMDARPVPPTEVMRRMLRTLGVAEERTVAEEDERADLYRAELRGRSTLLVLDNAADEAQVRPRLATGAGSLGWSPAGRRWAAWKSAPGSRWTCCAPRSPCRCSAPSPVCTEAREVCTEALRLSRLAQARNSEADALHRLGMGLHGQGNAAGAVELLQDSVALTSDDRITAVAQLLGLLASVHDDLGNADETRACRLRALDICSRSQTSATREPGEALRRALRV
jgi:hypothetical protein